MDAEPGPDRNLAFAALLLVITTFWLPFWVVRLQDEGGVTTSAFKLFAPFAPVTTSWAPVASGVLLVLVGLALVVRLAARSWYHEPAAWRATLAGSAVASLLSVLLLLAWPNSVPSAWGRRSLQDADGTVIATETTMPGLAWYLALVAAVLLGGAWWLTRPEANVASDTSDK